MLEISGLCWCSSPAALTRSASVFPSVCLTLLTAPERLNPVWKQLAPSDLINRGPGQRARGNIPGLVLSYNQFGSIDSMIGIQRADAANRTLYFNFFLFFLTLNMSLINPRQCGCGSVSVSRRGCVYGRYDLFLKPSVVKWEWHLIWRLQETGQEKRKKKKNHF